MTNSALIPAEIPAGLPFSARLDLADYPAPDWVVTVYLRGPKSVDLAATPDETAHLVTAPQSDTEDWPAGRYWYAVRAAKGTSLLEVERGQLQVLPDLAAAGDAYDGRTENEKALEAINAILAKRATKDQQSYKINNRELHRMTVTELLKLRGFYASQVRRERRISSGSGTFGRPIYVRMK